MISPVDESIIRTVTATFALPFWVPTLPMAPPRRPNPPPPTLLSLLVPNW
jgi:hypothetical protein